LSTVPEPRPARVRIFLPTYRRHDLLPRALASLRAQTVGDWICELHNDDPSDAFPAGLVQEMGDARILLRTHERNLGAIASFNLFFRPASEPYCALLEDDNWWEPRFLETMLNAMDRHPAATLGWCNQRVWLEQSDGSWSAAGRYVNPPESGDTPRLVPWGDFRQALGALHANGAMLLRTCNGASYPTPAIPFAGVEPYRERLIPHPLLYVPSPLAHFAVTRQSARSRDLAEWSAYQTVLLGSFVRQARLDAAGYRALWRHYHSQTPAPTGAFLFAGMLWKECRPFLRLARLRDWIRFLTGIAAHPIRAWAALRVAVRHPDWLEILNRNTAERFASEQVAQPDRGAPVARTN
jgi:Glycosyl transferase family 2